MKRISLPSEPKIQFGMETETNSKTVPNIENSHHSIEQKMASDNDIVRNRTTSGGYSTSVQGSNLDSLQELKNSQFKDTGPSINVRFEKSEGLKDKFHKFINEKFRRDYNGQKKKSRRNLK